jgi:UDP-GlcNAc:undecaprenyl-phosphate GlcNAc-1-phosphate transferase
MKDFFSYFFSVALFAFLITFLITPLIKKIALKLGITDKPTDRKIHKIPTAQLGGIAIWAGFVSAVLVNITLDKILWGIIVGATLIVIIGIIDDIFSMPPWIKLISQIIIAFITFKFGIAIFFITNPLGGVFYLKWLALPLTIFWIVGMINTINLIDGLDGLAAGISAISAFIIAAVAALSGQYAVTILALAVFGASVGFLRYNFSPAQIFMGDTGSMFLGYILASTTIIGVLKSPITMSLSIPLLILGVPISDTIFAIFRRIKKKQPIMAPDKEHLHHQLLSLGLSQKQVVVFIYIASIFLGILALVLCMYKGLASIFIFTGFLVVIFGGFIFIKKKRAKVFRVLQLFL